MHDLKKYLFVFILSSIISAYLFEYYLIYKNDELRLINKKSLTYKNLSGKVYDKRKLYEIYDNLNQNHNITITVHPTDFFKDKDLELLPLSGLSNTLTINCNENGYYSIYKTDRYGFNNPDDEWENKEIEYILIGDSFGHGACVNRPNDIASQLRKLTNKSVLNLSYTANGPLLEYATLKEYFKQNTKNVIWLYYEDNDLEDLEYELSIDLLKKYILEDNFSQNLITKQNELDEQIKKKINPIINYRKSLSKKDKNLKYSILKFLRLNNTKKIFRKKNLPNIQNFENIFNKIHNYTKKNNSTLYFVYLPSFYRYKLTNYEKNYNIIKNFVVENDVKFIDINEELFMQEAKPLDLFPFKSHGHYNELGYKKISEIIYKSVIK